MKSYLLLLCYFCLHETNSAPFIDRIKSGVGNMVKNLGSKLLGKVAGTDVPAMPGMPGTNGKPGTVLEQLQFLNSMMKQVTGFMTTPTARNNPQMKTINNMLTRQIIPQFDKLNISDDQLKTHHKLSPDDILKFRALLQETRDQLHEMKRNIQGR